MRGSPSEKTIEGVPKEEWVGLQVKLNTNPPPRPGERDVVGLKAHGWFPPYTEGVVWRRHGDTGIITRVYDDPFLQQVVVTWTYDRRETWVYPIWLDPVDGVMGRLASV